MFWFDIKFDFIIGNPPFNVGGKIKTPCLKNFNKKKDGKRAWDSFVRKSVESLNDGGFLLFITPSIWMKKNNYFHEYMTQLIFVDYILSITPKATTYFTETPKLPPVTIYCKFQLEEDMKMRIELWMYMTKLLRNM